MEKSVNSERKHTRINPYDTLTELHMISFYKSLSEKNKRLYAGAEAIKLPFGGITYISDLFGCDRKTVARGMMELKNPKLKFLRILPENMAIMPIISMGYGDFWRNFNVIPLACKSIFLNTLSP